MKIIKIGKGPLNDLVITDKTVSREHVQLFIDDEKNVFVTDLESTNGTYINGKRIEDPVKLKALDILLIGNSLIEWPKFLENNTDQSVPYDSITNYIDEFKEESNYMKQWKRLKSFIKNKIKGKNFLIFNITVIALFSMSFLQLSPLTFNTNKKTVKLKNKIIDVFSDKQTQRKKQRTDVTYDFSCLSNKGDAGSTEMIYNFGELTRDIQSSFFKGIDVSISDEIKVGKNLLKSFRKKYKFITTGSEIENLTSIKNDLNSRLANPRGFPYKIYLVDDPMLNAMTSGGYIFFFKGMYDFCKTNSEIATIISHEIAHNELGHLTLGLKKQKVANSWGVLGQIALGLESVATQSFNQKQETEADLFGADIIYPTSFKNCNAIDLWERMSNNDRDFNIIDGFFSSHPYSKNRSKCIKKHLKVNYNKDCR